MKKTITQIVGENIRFVRKERKLTQAQLAEIAVTSTEYISLIERGKRGGSLQLILRIALALDIPLDHLTYIH